MKRTGLWFALVVGSLAAVVSESCDGQPYVCIAWVDCSLSHRLDTMGVNATGDADARAQCARANGGACCTCRKA